MSMVMLMLMPTPLLAELDPVQIAIVVIAFVGGFIQWLWSLIQQGKADAEARQTPETPEERKLREDAWRRQTQGQGQGQGQGQDPGQRQERPSPSRTPPPRHDPFASVREIFEEMKRAAREAQEPHPQPAPPPPAPVRPPALPTSQPPSRRGSVSADLGRRSAAPPPKRHSVAADLAPDRSARPHGSAHTPPVSLPTAPASPLLPQTAGDLTSSSADTAAGTATTGTPMWGALLASPAALRQAFILREILGPPKALQTAGDSAA